MRRFAGVMEVIDQPLYDVISLPDDCQDLRASLFVKPLGTMHVASGLAQIKHYIDTNMVMSAQLDAPKSFLLDSVRALFTQDDRPLPLDHPLWFNTFLRLSIMQKSYFEAPAWLWADPLVLGLATDWSSWPKEMRQELTKSYRRTFTTPFEIGTHAYFSVQAEFAAMPASPPTDLHVVLEGRLARAIC